MQMRDNQTLIFYRLMIVEMKRIGGNTMGQAQKLDMEAEGKRRGCTDSPVPDLEIWVQY